MLGIRKVDTTYLTHKEFGVDCFLGCIGSCVDIAEQMLGLVSFGRLTADWSISWFNLTFRPPKGFSFRRHS